MSATMLAVSLFMLSSVLLAYAVERLWQARQVSALASALLATASSLGAVWMVLL